MNAFARCNKNKYLMPISTILIGLFLLIGLQGCNSSSSTPAENASGYFTGSITVKGEDNLTDLPIIEGLQGMVSGNRFMFMSIDEVLLYDGVFTSITGSSFSGTVSIYKDGVLVSDTTAVAGTITGESSITGTLTGEGLGNGNFELTYSLNNAPSANSRIVINDFGYNGRINLSDDLGNPRNITAMGVSNTGVFSRIGNLALGDSSTGFERCLFEPELSKILPIADINVYSVNITFSGCDNALLNGVHTGFATTQDDSDLWLNIAFSNGLLSANILMFKNVR